MEQINQTLSEDRELLNSNPIFSEKEAKKPKLKFRKRKSKTSDTNNPANAPELKSKVITEPDDLFNEESINIADSKNLEKEEELGLDVRDVESGEIGTDEIYNSVAELEAQVYQLNDQLGILDLTDSFEPILLEPKIGTEEDSKKFVPESYMIDTQSLDVIGVKNNFDYKLTADTKSGTLQVENPAIIPKFFKSAERNYKNLFNDSGRNRTVFYARNHQLINGSQMILTEKTSVSELSENKPGYVFKNYHNGMIYKEKVINQLVREHASATKAESFEPLKTIKPKSPDKLGSLTILASQSLETSKKNRHIDSESLGKFRPLLEISREIVVGDTNLRQVYESRLISERGLRRAVTTYLKGGDVRRILAEELLIKEISYELDPNLRDRPMVSTKTTNLEHGTLSSSKQDNTKINDNHQLLDETDSLKIEKNTITDQKPTRPILIIANVIALVILGILVIWLLAIKK